MAREAKCTKHYVDPDGTDHRSVCDIVDRLEFRFADGTVQAVKLSDFPEAIIAKAAWHGLSQKFGDSYSGKKTVADCIEAFSEMVDQVKEGDWITVSEGGGPRISQLATAYFRAMSAAGHELTEADAVEKVKGWDTDKRKAAQEVPEIALALQEIRAEQAAERLAKAKAAAAESEGSGLTDL